MIIHFCENIDQEITFLNEEESQHVLKVLRKKSGDKLFVINGNGTFCEAQIIQENTRNCKIQVLKKEIKQRLRNYNLHIAIAPTKNIDRFEWFVEKAVEIGISEITPLTCFHSERRVLKEDRIMKIIISASKQSQEFYFPKLNKLTGFDEFIKQQRSEFKYIAHCYQDKKILLWNHYQKNENALILIGPEGDFSEKEVEQAIKTGFVPVSLGESRLRTETAGIVACNTVSIINQLK